MEPNTERCRQLLMSWRDRQIIRAYQLLNSCALEARNQLEQQLDQASFWDSAWDPAGFANHRIDALLGGQLQSPLRTFYDQAGDELRAIAPRLAALSAIVREGLKIEFPNASDVAAEAPEQVEHDAAEPSAASQNWLKRIGDLVATPAGKMAAYTADTADWLVQDKVGLRNRLRHAALDRINEVWMRDVGQPASVLGQVIGFIDAATDEARSAAW